MSSGDQMTGGHGYNDAAHLRIVQAVRLGATKAIAAQAGGIGTRTLHRWLSDGKRNPDGPFHKLWRDVQAAEGASATHALSCIVKAAKEGKWQASAWLLERRHGYRRDGVADLREHAVMPGDLSKHESEILGEVRRLRVSATEGGSHVAAARLLEMEAGMVQTKLAAQRADEERAHANADQTELLSVLESTLEGMPRSVLDKVADILADKRRRAS